MDIIDKKLLSIIQKDFPICSHPFKEIGATLGITEEETLNRLKKLKEQGVIRRLGAIMDSRKLGYKSTLCAMEVPEEKIPEVAAILDKYIGITHNYLRNHKYNMWFTLITPSEEHLQKTLADLEQKTGYKIYSLPAKKLFKIKVNFHVPGLEEEKISAL
ncbi:MAG: Lrp/AsnC family transcriptional regulator [Clostridia bacterium]|nr:Lrp/AsnC family transcriptional regulator [Clostridia bacterium]